jgi:hypothetical protein
MQWRTAGTGALFLVGLLGCPHEYGREGTVDRAVHKDVMELQRKRCSTDELQKFCGNNKKSKQCREKCG